MKIDIDAVLRSRLGSRYRFVPRFAVAWLERLICQDRLNSVLEAIGEREGVDAARVALNHLNITLRPAGIERLKVGKRYIFASNHPLGGLDGIALIALIGEHYGGQIRFMVNDLLMTVKPFENVFLPVNKFGKQSREYAAAIDAAYDHPTLQMLTFPAGLCSRRRPDGTIADPEWHRTLVTRAIRHQRSIVPVFFSGSNSDRFYRTAMWRKRLGIKFNFEQVLLPSEVFKNAGTTFKVIIGEPIDYTTLDRSQAAAETMRIRQLVYQLPKNHS